MNIARIALLAAIIPNCDALLQLMPPTISSSSSPSAFSALGRGIVGRLPIRDCRSPTRCLNGPLRLHASSSSPAFPEGKQTPDGRSYRVFSDDAQVGEYIAWRVADLAKRCIEDKGAFSMSIGSGTTVKPLATLASTPGIDFSKVHVFFGNERTVGDTAYKCHEGALGFITACGIPSEQAYRVPSGGGDPAKSASAYEQLMNGMQPSVVGRCAETGLASLDLVLLGSGADGHTASLYPGSKQVLISPSKRLVTEAEGKGGVTLTLDAINSARNVMLSAGKESQAPMVGDALAGSNRGGMPAGMIGGAREGCANVEWLLTEASASAWL